MRVSVACMSRAGREPGFKKTNQDNCFAFEKYITEDQSLFGAMDGHGPHGALSGGVALHPLGLSRGPAANTAPSVGWARSVCVARACHVAPRCPRPVCFPHAPHAGHLVSGYVKQHLPIILVNHLTSDKDVRRALTSGFVEVDRSLGQSRIDCEFSGSTAVVSYLKVRRCLDGRAAAGSTCMAGGNARGSPTWGILRRARRATQGVQAGARAV